MSIDWRQSGVCARSTTSALFRRYTHGLAVCMFTSEQTQAEVSTNAHLGQYQKMELHIRSSLPRGFLAGIGLSL